MSELSISGVGVTVRTETDLPQTLMRGDETTQPVNYDVRSGPPAVPQKVHSTKGRIFIEVFIKSDLKQVDMSKLFV